MKRRCVYVPVVRLHGQPGAPVATALCTLWCESAPVGEPPRDVPCDADKRLAPVAAPLLNAQLFESGCTAAMAVPSSVCRPRDSPCGNGCGPTPGSRRGACSPPTPSRAWVTARSWGLPWPCCSPAPASPGW